MILAVNGGKWHIRLIGLWQDGWPPAGGEGRIPLLVVTNGHGSFVFLVVVYHFAVNIAIRRVSAPFQGNLELIVGRLVTTVVRD